jgi:hypothetical protein
MEVDPGEALGGEGGGHDCIRSAEWSMDIENPPPSCCTSVTALESPSRTSPAHGLCTLFRRTGDYSGTVSSVCREASRRQRCSSHPNSSSSSDGRVSSPRMRGQHHLPWTQRLPSLVVWEHLSRHWMLIAGAFLVAEPACSCRRGCAGGAYSPLTPHWPHTRSHLLCGSTGPARDAERRVGGEMWR